MIAAGGVRAVLELAGVRDILTKSLGTTNPINLVRATVAGLQSLKTPQHVARLRGLSVAQVLGLEPARRGARPRRSGRGGLSAWRASEITQVKSAIGSPPDHRGTLRALGLKRIGQTRGARGQPGHPRHGQEGRVPPRGAPGNEEVVTWLRLGLHNLRPNAGSTKNTKRLGRGKGSGQGKTAGKGHKGYNARSGGGVRPGYEGGQMPIYMRLGKLRGPHMKKSMPIGPFRTYAVPVNVGRLAQAFAAGDEVTPEALVDKGIVKNTTHADQDPRRRRSRRGAHRAHARLLRSAAGEDRGGRRHSRAPLAAAQGS